MPEQDDDAVVSYSVKELLAGMRQDLSAGLAEIKEALGTKADKGDIAKLEGRLDGHETRIEGLESERDERRGSRGAHEKRDALDLSGRQRLIASAYGLGTLIVGVLAAHPWTW